LLNASHLGPRFALDPDVPVVSGRDPAETTK